jgi:hypothetical protein
VLPVAMDPALGGAQRDPLGAGQPGQGHALLEVGPQEREPL